MAILMKLVLDTAPELKSLRADIPEAVNTLLVDMLHRDRDRRPIDGDALAP